jgi:putative CocE/NonD family hydrolase
MPARLNLAPPLRSMANLAEDFFELRRRWFDRWIKGLANGIDEEPSVRVFVMGGGSGRHNRDGRLDHGGYWRSAVGWPLPQTRWTRLYLHADGSLAAAPAAGSGAVDYAFDPHDPAPMVGGAISSGEPVMHAGAFDQSAAALRSDVLMFATAPLDVNSKSPGRARCGCGSPLTLPTRISRRN